MLRPTSGRAEIFGLDAQRDTLAAHRRLAYVGGETSLWPSLAGAETLHLLGRVQGRSDPAYRDELIERFALDPSKKVRGYSKGNRQKLALTAELASRADLLDGPGTSEVVDHRLWELLSAAMHRAETQLTDLMSELASAS
jgi:ABC-2 type transport system ATP-binding protein